MLGEVSGATSAKGYIFKSREECELLGEEKSSDYVHT
jgi:hypothetical protein